MLVLFKQKYINRELALLAECPWVAAPNPSPLGQIMKSS